MLTGNKNNKSHGTIYINFKVLLKHNRLLDNTVIKHIYLDYGNS